MFLRSGLVGLLVAGALSAQNAASIGDEELGVLIDELIPVVERHAGREFEKRPEVLVADQREAAEALADDFFMQFRGLYAGLDERSIRGVAERKAGSLASALMGKYGFESRTLYILPGNIEAFVGRVGVDREQTLDVLRVVVAHELVHALQNQHVELASRLRQLDDQDRMHTLSARMEGHAVFVEDRVAAELGIVAAAHTLRRILEGRADLGSATRYTAFQLRSSRMWNRGYYMMGALRMEELFEAGGHKRVWATLAADPPPSRVLFRDALDPDPQPVEPLDGVLDGVEEYFGRGRWPAGRGTLGEMVLRSESSHVQEELDAVLASFRGGAFCEASAPTPLLMGSVYAMAFADGDSAARFVALAEQSAVVDGEAVTGVGRYEVRDAPAPPGATGRAYVQSPSLEGVGKVVRGKVAWLRKDRFVVQVTGTGIVVSDEQVVEIAEIVFRRLAGR